MDPNVALATLRDLSRRATSGEPWNDSSEPADLALEMGEAWEALDGWLTKGGFTPAAWVVDPGSREMNIRAVPYENPEAIEVTLHGRTARLTPSVAYWLMTGLADRIVVEPIGLRHP